ncbi:efflux RND transporter periplasmic adaptor subunit [Entomomonas moraniae]|uniref:Efflux RND transporter periplasmic adaptor subunit n=1 Tax=Entomomonas moraniae TaxID=2213226 RepID=A0A3Q9JJY1_9GAMM|nr:efflux RND transporter periplasmic adaptor subunit [Entomomonas moraniae]AZS51269.1 efflux RND transporter periplasmic adaptor subunit [Entomomonas moraniae]
MKKAKKTIILSMILIIIITLIYFFFFNKEEQISYLTEKARIGNIQRTVNTTGEISAKQIVTVGAQASGQIKKLYVSLGQSIKKGDMIADIDSTTQENDLNINKSKLESYKTQLEAKKVALVVAQKKYNREKNLLTKNATSDENLDSARDTLATAKANVADLESLIVQTQISVNTAETNLGYTKIVAPLDGTVVSIPVEEGQTVNANQTTPTIVQVADLKLMEIKMQISEGDITKIKPGMEVIYSILSEPTKTFTGKLDTIDPGLTTLTAGNYTGTTDSSTAVYYYGNLVVPNPDGTLRIGMTTQNTIVVSNKDNVLIIPTITLNTKNGRSYVYVLEKNNTVVEKEVTIGLSDSMNTEIISGLKDGENVISAQMSNTEIVQSNNSRMRGPRL